MGARTGPSPRREPPTERRRGERKKMERVHMKRMEERVGTFVSYVILHVIITC